MASGVSLVDSLIRDYLVFRGFTATLKCFDADCKNDKDHKFKVETITQEVVSLISNHDLKGLRLLWDHFDSLFKGLTQFQCEYARRLENDLYKLYLANCVQQNKPDKVASFFDVMTTKLHKTDGWGEWFALPYLSNVAETEPFKRYFSKSWQEMFLVCVHNFLSIAFYQMQPPALLAASFATTDSPTMVVRHASGTRVAFQVSDGLARSNGKDAGGEVNCGLATDLMDDFAIIAQCQGSRSSVPHSSSSRSLRSVLRRKFASKKNSPNTD